MVGASASISAYLRAHATGPETEDRISHVSTAIKTTSYLSFFDRVKGIDLVQFSILWILSRPQTPEQVAGSRTRRKKNDPRFACNASCGV